MNRPSTTSRGHRSSPGGGSLSLIIGLLASGVYILRRQKKYVDMEPPEWEHFLYVGKVACFRWSRSIFDLGRVPVTYLPTLYFAVLMLDHMLDHFIFSSRWYTTKTDAICFGICALSIIVTFWWFKGMVFGIDGPINEHRGLRWCNGGVRSIDSVIVG